MHPLFLKNNSLALSQLPTVAIVILNWNGKRFLEQFLPSVMQTTYAAAKIIVADNASTDDSIAFLNQYYPSIVQIHNPSNQGFAKGYNTALNQVQAKYYILLNSDVEVTPGWIEPVIELMEKDNTIAACQPKILSYSNKTGFEYAGAAGGWIDAYGYAFCRGRLFNDCEEDKGQYNTVEPIFWASGCALFIRSDIYHSVNGMDELFFAHQEEIDMCWRIQLAGYKIMACPSSVVYHVGGGTLPQGNPRKIFLNYRNNLIMMYKNYPFFVRLWKIPFRLILDGISVIEKLTSGDFSYLPPVFKAHMSFYKWMFSKKQTQYFPAKKAGIPAGVYNNSIVWQYFAKGKKKFSEIIDNKA